MSTIITGGVGSVVEHETHSKFLNSNITPYRIVKIVQTGGAVEQLIKITAAKIAKYLKLIEVPSHHNHGEGNKLSSENCNLCRRRIKFRVTGTEHHLTGSDADNNSNLQCLG